MEERSTGAVRLVRTAAYVLLCCGLGLLAMGFLGTWQRQSAQNRDARLLEDPVGLQSAPHHAAQTAPPRPLRHGDVLGLLRIPTRGLETSIRAGVESEQLDVAAGHIPGTALPGSPGNSVVVGHRDTVFAALEEVALHDEIELRTPRGEKRYRVSDLEVVDPRHLSILSPTEDERLTLVTCYPFRWLGPAPKRFVITALAVDS